MGLLGQNGGRCLRVSLHDHGHVGSCSWVVVSLGWVGERRRIHPLVDYHGMYC